MGQAKRSDDSESVSTVFLHERAADNLSFIREAMTRASAFTDVPGWGTVLMGVIALAGGAVATLRYDAYWWMDAWCAVAVIAGGTGWLSIYLKARKSGTPLRSGPGRRMAANFAPPMVAGCFLTLLFFELGMDPWLPGMWLLLYGTAVVCSGAFSVRVIPVMGMCFMITGMATAYSAFWLREPLIGNYYAGDIGMAVGFGGLNLLFGLIIARRYGG